MKERALPTSGIGACLVGVAVGASCLRPTDGRVARDEAVGIAETSGSGIAVADGLAVVRALDVGTLSLWASAPVFDAELDTPPGAARVWSIDLRNALVDAQLIVTVDGSALPVTTVDIEPVTRKRWEVELPPAATIRLRVTTADAADRDPWRFALLSDVQEAIGDVQDLFDLLDAESGRERVHFLLGAGDLTETGTRKQLERFQRELESLDVPYYTTLGNHELGTRPTPFHELFGRGSFRFTFRGVQFTLIDSGSATLDPTVYEWLDGWLREGRDGVHVVAMHIPPLDPSGVRNGGFASRAEAAKLLTRLANGGVDLTLYGHIHSHYAFRNGGIRAHISGGGGAIPERFDRVGRHFMVFRVGADDGVLDERVVQVR